MKENVTTMNRPRIAIIGLGFGAEFIPIYQRHPDAELRGICQRNVENLHKIGDAFSVPAAHRYARYEEVLADPEVDAVHINSPIGEHAWMSVEGLKAGKHVACTVPMGTTLDELKAIVRAQRESGKLYMMMETVVYSREFLFVREMVEKGELGRLQFLRGSHQQDMSVGWPEYWWGFPPMHYATHAVSPLFLLAKAMPEKVNCYGSGRIREEYIPRYGSPFAVESALFKLKDSDLACEATRSLYETVRQYRESFDVYGEKMSFEWEQVAGEGAVLHTGGEDIRRTHIPDYADRLPESIREFTTKGVYDLAENEHLSFFQGAGHGGSHPHLAHEFVRALVEGRPPVVDHITAASITGAGICAHQSALANGETVYLPDFAAV
jgi:predicted dehydrogenase